MLRDFFDTCDFQFDANVHIDKLALLYKVGYWLEVTVQELEGSGKVPIGY